MHDVIVAAAVFEYIVEAAPPGGEGESAIATNQVS
jgi:hypothetical protein